MEGGEMAGMVAVVMTMGIPLAAIFTSHIRKMEEIRRRSSEQHAAIGASDVQQMRAQLTELRDITTHYDLSFDQSLQRIEARTARLEDRVAELERERAVTAQIVR